MATGSNAAVPVFFSYSHADLAALERLRVHLKAFVRQGLIRYWDDGVKDSLDQPRPVDAVWPRLDSLDFALGRDCNFGGRFRLCGRPLGHH